MKLFIHFVIFFLVFSCAAAQDRSADERLQGFIEGLNTDTKTSDVPFDADLSPDDTSYIGRNLQEAFGEMSRSYYLAKATHLPDNNESWYARWKVLNAAKHSIDTTYFMVYNDIFGKSFLGLLLKKAEEGVKIRLMIDSRGSSYFSNKGIDYLEELAANPNIKIKIYNSILKELPKLPFNLRYVTASNHDKIIVVDGKTCVTGGRNIGNVYFCDPEDMPEAWRDTDITIDSATTAVELKQAFDEEFAHSNNWNVTPDWLGNWSSKRKKLLYAYYAMDNWLNGKGAAPSTLKYARWEEQIRGMELNNISDDELESRKPDTPDMYNAEIMINKKMQNLRNFKVFRSNTEYPLKIIDKHSFIGKTNSITDAICKFIDSSKEEIVIQNPYVVLTNKAWTALKRASDRGVKIIIHTNSPLSSDSLFTQAFFLEDWKKMLEEMKTCRIFVFTGKRNLHSKTFVFDRTISVIGTYNMDPMSEEINSEVVTAVNSPEFSEGLHNAIMNDIKESTELSLGIGTDGKYTDILGPAQMAPEKVLRIMKLLKKFKFLRPLI